MSSAKWWTVAAHEYAHHVRRKGFIASTLGLPILMIIAVGLIGFFIARGETISGVGYVDQSTLTTGMPERTVITDTLSPDVSVLRYADESAARTALEAEAIVGYVVIPADYIQTGLLRGVANDDSMPSSAQQALNKFLRQTIVSNVDAQRQERLLDPVEDVIQRSLDTQREATQAQGFLLFFVPYLFGIFLMVSVFASSSYLMTALVEEKENRIMEILATSLRPISLMAGKIIGLGLLGLTQIAIWVLSLFGIFFIARSMFAFLAELTLPINVIILALVMFVPTYLLIAAGLSAVGAAVSSVQEGQQLSGIVTILMVLPLWFLPLIIEAPNGAFAVGLSLAPFTSPLTMMQRIALTTVPLWQIVASVAIQSASAVAMIWLASRVLRFGMLRYGKRLNFREFMQALRG